MPVLVSLSGLPGVGKTTLAREIAVRVRAMHLRVDSVEAAVKNSDLGIDRVEDSGYLAIAAIARDNLRLGFNVIADTVNPIELTRRLWADTALSGNAKLLNVEVICSDQTLHQQRVESRKSDIEGLVMPDWQAILDREFEPWLEERLTVDTCANSIKECAAIVVDRMAIVRAKSE